MKNKRKKEKRRGVGGGGAWGAKMAINIILNVLLYKD